MTASSLKASGYPHGAGLVLAGGLSRRMGKDKALISPCGEGGPTLLDSSFALLFSIFPHTMVSCAQGETRPGYPCIEDAFPRCGPAGAILSALEQLEPKGARYVLALACDIPLMRKDILERLIAAHTPTALTTLFHSSRTGRSEPLAAIYSVDAIPFFRNGLRKGRRSLRHILPESSRQLVEIRPDEELCFFNCNTPGDLAALTVRSSSQ